MATKPNAATYDDLLPPLSTEEFEALRSDIKANGVLHPVFLDEEGNVLDGRHRLKIDPDAPRKIIRGLTPAEKEAFVFRANFVRRNLSPDQKREARQRMKATAKRLREEDAKKWTLVRVGAALGVSKSTVESWFPPTTISSSGNGGSRRLRCPKCGRDYTQPPGHICVRPDARLKVPPESKAAIAERVESGEPQAQVAADIGVSQQAVSKIVNAERKAAEAKKERETAAKKIEGDCGVIHGDFREHGGIVADASVDLILTDPPYDESALDLYSDLATFAARVLRPGGWLMSYSGQAHLMRTMAAMQSAPGIEYGWMFCCLHSGGDLRFRKFKLQNGWKPIIGFYREPLAVAWDWFKDVVSGGKEKDLHEWQQSESEAAHFIERLSAPNGFVCDPFAGSATTLSAAKKLGRRWIGFEVNEDHVKSARIRLNDAAT